MGGDEFVERYAELQISDYRFEIQGPAARYHSSGTSRLSPMASFTMTRFPWSSSRSC
jgi:hypothetical protein